MHSLMHTSCSSKDIPPPDPSLPSPQFPKGRKWQDTQCLIVSSWLQVVLFTCRWKIIEKIPFHGMKNVSQIEKRINNFTWTVWSGLFWESTSRMSNCEAWTYVLMPSCQVESCFFVQIAVVGYFESLHYKVKYPQKKITNYETCCTIVLHIECPRAEIMARTGPCIKQVFSMQIS